MRINRKHWLEGGGVVRRQTPNLGGRIAPRWLVFHYTAGRTAEGAVESLCTRKPAGNASAHLVLGRDGRLWQLAPFDHAAWHAGVSHWQGVSGLNQHSIGIELDNAGRLTRQGARYVAWFGAEYPEDQVVQARHKNESAEAHWHAYTEAQLALAQELAVLLTSHYALEDILGHDDIAPGRKSDPGPAFPLESLRASVLGREQDAPPRQRVSASALNIRSGPGVEHPSVATALPRGTEVVVLEQRDRWARVELTGARDVEGWVHSRHLEPVAP